MYKVPPHVLLKAREAEQRYLVAPPDKTDNPKRAGGGVSPYYRILLKMKEEKARRQFDAV